MAGVAQALKLIALDREGLGVISAHIQDTCVKRVDMTWLPKQRRFVVAGMRYDWVGAKTGPEERVSSVLRFDRVLKVSHLGLKDNDPDAAGVIFLAFADGGLVRLDVECVEVELRDMGHRVPAQACPGHALTDSSAA
jgi:Protein of unknown function (DUF2948)